MEEKDYLKKIYRSLRSSFIIIGLTGRLGAGVSTAAERIYEVFENTEETQKFLSRVKCCEWLNQIDRYEQLRARRLEKFWMGLNSGDDNNYEPVILKVRLILLILFKRLLDLGEGKFKEDFLKFLKENLVDKGNLRRELLEDLNEFIETLKTKISELNISLDNSLFKENYKDLEVDEVKDLINRFTDLDSKIGEDNKFIYIRFLQELGRFLRSLDYCPENIYEDEDNKILPCFTIVELLRRIIRIYRDKRKDKHKLFILDALRNNLEIEFFRNRYSNFYLFSILAEEDTRLKRLKRNGFNDEDIKNLIQIEKKKPKSEKELYEQNIEFCITKADVFIDNNTGESEFTYLKYQLIKYLTLIIHPGLIPPTKDEIFMQIAISARYASGCISRQVGAVVIGQDGYVRGIGWNDVPEGHVSCSLRDFELFEEKKAYFSPYERKELAKLYSNYKIKWKDKLPFCFKDMKNFSELKKNIKEIEKKLKEESYDDDEIEEITKTIEEYVKAKNPTRERALHAEENAYIQAAKVGGVSVKGGTLYTTDFPCQLCSKKTIQLQISRVVYIEDYPDISREHTLRTNPDLKIDFFRGAIREAYFKLYAPFMPLKDEIEFYLKTLRQE